MQALLLAKPKQFLFQEIQEPQVPDADDVLVRVYAVGICGTDYGGYLGKMPFFSYPRIPGHELGVEVAQQRAAHGLEDGGMGVRRTRAQKQAFGKRFQDRHGPQRSGCPPSSVRSVTS